jgi:hypothetical protein
LELEGVIAKCLEKKPEGRYLDVGALARALAPFGGAHAGISVERITKIVNPGGVPVPPESPNRVSITSSPGNRASAFAATAASTSVNLPESPVQPRERSPLMLVAAAVLAVCVVAGIFFSVREKPGDATSNATETTSVDAPAKPVLSTASSTAPVIAPAGTATTPPEPVASADAGVPLSAKVATTSPPPSPVAITARPVVSAKPASSKSTKKNPAYDPFADQH